MIKRCRQPDRSERRAPPSRAQFAELLGDFRQLRLVGARAPASRPQFRRRLIAVTGQLFPLAGAGPSARAANTDPRSGSVGGCDGSTTDQVKIRKQRLGLLREVGQEFLRERRGSWKLDLQRVPVDPSDAELVVKVRAGCESGAPDVSDDLTLFDSLARTNPSREPRQV